MSGSVPVGSTAPKAVASPISGTGRSSFSLALPQTTASSSPTTSSPFTLDLGRARAPTMRDSSTGRFFPGLRDRSASIGFDQPHIDEGWIPPSEWEARAMRRFPEVLELRERVRHILGLESYARRPNLASTELRDTLHPDIILALIDRYLKKHGFNKARSMLRMESNVFTQDNPVLLGEALEDDDLVGLVRLGSTPDVFDDPPEGEVDPELEAGMYGIILVTDVDVNIWKDPLTPRTVRLNETPTSASSSSASTSSSSSSSKDLSDAVIRGATLNRLVVLLCTAKARDTEFRRVFFGALHSFSSPPQILNKFIEFYQRPGQKLSHQDVGTLASLIRYWFDHHPFDFTMDVKKILGKFIESHLVRDGRKGAAQKLQAAIPGWEAKLAALESGQVLFGHDTNTGGPSKTVIPVPGVVPQSPSLSARGSSVKVAPEPKVPKNIFSPLLSIDDVDEEEIARQLTVVDFERFRTIQSAEFFNRRWTVDGGRAAPRLAQLLQRFDRVAHWVSQSIADRAQEGVKQKRIIKIIARMLKIAEYLRMFRNYQSLFAIASGLRSAVAWRIVQTYRKDLPKSAAENLTFLEETFDWAQWHRRYYKDFAATDAPCIPAVPLHLQQICLFEDAMPDKLDERLINWDKRRKIWDSIQPLLASQSMAYQFYKVQQICDLIDRPEPDDSMY